MNTPKCDHCRRQMAFGIFKLTLARSGDVLTKNLCADCGFNIVNYRTMRLYQFDRTYTPPTGGERTQRQEVMSFKALYSKSDLVDTFTGTLVLAKLDQQRREELAVAEREARSEHGMRERGLTPRPNVQPKVVHMATIGAPGGE